ncbi:MAG: hypothetical protein V4663_14585 [Bacteroidota bacterium]
MANSDKISIVAIFISVIALTPLIISLLSTTSVKGKLISSYINILGKNENTAMILKISLVATNKSLVFEDIDISVKFSDSGWLTGTTSNNRITIFKYEEFKKLNVPANEFINQITYLEKDKPVVGYLSTKFDYVDETPEEVRIIFKLFNGDIKTLTLKYPDSKKMHFDDTIWDTITLPEIKALGLL